VFLILARSGKPDHTALRQAAVSAECFYAAVFNGSGIRIGAVPTVCTVGYQYDVGSAD